VLALENPKCLVCDQLLERGRGESSIGAQLCLGRNGHRGQFGWN
jgi:hypothetical protein